VPPCCGELRLELSYRPSTPTLDFFGDAELVDTDASHGLISRTPRIVSWTSCRTDARARRLAARPAGGGGAEHTYIAVFSATSLALWKISRRPVRPVAFNRAGLHLLTTGAGCSTKTPSVQIWSRKGQIWEEKVWLDVDTTVGTLRVPACASHPVAHKTRPPWALRSRTGERSTIGP
jgi:hypothetical protein